MIITNKKSQARDITSLDGLQIAQVDTVSGVILARKIEPSKLSYKDNDAYEWMRPVINGKPVRIGKASLLATNYPAAGKEVGDGKGN